MGGIDISVVMPVRDAESTIDAAVDSVLASRDVRLELLCVDDGSRDATPGRLAARARLDPRVRVISSGGGGLCAALRAGLEHCSAPLVARTDADDEVHPLRLASQVAALRSRPRTWLLGCRVESFRDRGTVPPGWARYTRWCNEVLDADAHRREAFVDCPLPHPTWAFRRDLIRGLGAYPDLDWPEDLDLLYRILAAGGRVEKLPRVLHRWRDHPGRLSRTDPRYDRRAMTRVKARWLPRVYPMRAAVVWGAGRTGRRLARALGEEGVAIEALLDIAPRRAGRRWHGIPILSPDELPAMAPRWRAKKLRILAAVAQLGAREEIRRRLRRADLEEGADFVMTS
jgi:glycosyltransferase involved in cell wall biosynthesis